MGEDSEESEESSDKSEDKKESVEKDSEKEAEAISKDSEPSKSEQVKDKEDTESLGDNAKEGEDKKAQEAEDEEEPSNLQLAWEMLELAKVAFTTKLKDIKEEDKKALEMKICETLLLLGEVSLENETYEQAVNDITECLNKRKVLHPADSRRIAETQYQLGVALGHFEKFDEAVKSLEEAIKCLKLRMENLKNKTSSVDEPKLMMLSTHVKLKLLNWSLSSPRLKKRFRIPRTCRNRERSRLRMDLKMESLAVLQPSPSLPSV